MRMERLAKVIDDHDVAVLLVDLRIEEPSAVRRDRKPIVEILFYFEEFSDLFRGEIEIAQRPGPSAGTK